MKKLLLNLYLLLLVTFTFGQQIMSSAGGSGGNAEVNINWTLGETAIQTFSNPTNLLTQGFHQTRLIVTAIGDLNLQNIHVSAYPNPATALLNIKIETGKSCLYTYTIENLAGKCVALNNSFAGNGTINLENFAPGVYILNIIPDDKSWVKTFKIVKQ